MLHADYILEAKRRASCKLFDQYNLIQLLLLKYSYLFTGNNQSESYIS